MKMTEKVLNFVVTGSRVRITTDLGEFEGTVASYDTNVGMITVKNVSCATNRSGLPKMMNFMKNEILELVVVSLPKKKANLNRKIDAVKTSSDSTGISSPNAVNGISEFPSGALGASGKPDIDCGNGKNSANTKTVDELSSGDEVHLLKRRESVPTEQTLLGGLPLSRVLKLSQCYDDPSHVLREHSVLKSFCEDFCLAVKWIKSLNVIGLAMEGKNLGRSGQLGWISICGKRRVFLFDVLSFGEKNLISHLRPVFENENILKVVHDCRGISDLLFHRHQVKFVNVFDTQVASLTASHRRYGFIPTSVDSLVGCLFEHLNLPQEMIYMEKELGYEFKSNPDVWIQRPAPEPTLQTAAFNVRYLNELRLRLTEEMLRDFIDGVDIYLGLYRDADDKELDKMQNATHTLPTEFRNLEVNAEASRRKTEELYSKDMTLDAAIRSAPALSTFVADRPPLKEPTHGNSPLHKGAISPNQSSASNIHSAADKDDPSPEDSVSIYDIIKLKQAALPKGDVVFLAAGSEPTIAVANERPKKLKAKLQPSTDSESEWCRKGRSTMPDNPRRMDVFEDFSVIPSPEKFHIGNCTLDSSVNQCADISYSASLQNSANSDVLSKNRSKAEIDCRVADGARLNGFVKSERRSTGAQNLSGLTVNAGTLVAPPGGKDASESLLGTKRPIQCSEELGSLSDASLSVDLSVKSDSEDSLSRIPRGRGTMADLHVGLSSLRSRQNPGRPVDVPLPERRLSCDVRSAMSSHSASVQSVGRGAAMLKLMRQLEESQPGPSCIKSHA